ncbi:hypothetical protein DXG01_004773 [Tephrocybe rancida]|nr:hypothetical protein DXG01_004773 [Tephrocybe rancida]
MPAGYCPSQRVEDDVPMSQPDDELPGLTKGKEFVFCYEDGINGCIYYTGEFVEGKREAWEKHSKWARYNSNQWYSSPNGLRAPRPPGITVSLVDDSSDSRSSYSGTARATRLDKEMTAARRKKSPPPTTEDEDADIDMQLANDVIPDEEPLTPHINMGKGRALKIMRRTMRICKMLRQVGRSTLHSPPFSGWSPGGVHWTPGGLNGLRGLRLDCGLGGVRWTRADKSGQGIPDSLTYYYNK